MVIVWSQSSPSVSTYSTSIVSFVCSTRFSSFVYRCIRASTLTSYPANSLIMNSFLASLLLGASIIGGVQSAPTPAQTTPSFSSVELQETTFPALTNPNAIPPLEQLAHGTLPNGPAPPAGAISDEGITNLQLIELNEFFETAFFTSLLANITNGVSGYEIHDQDKRTIVIDALAAIVAVSPCEALPARLS